VTGVTDRVGAGELVLPEGDELNSLFEVLANWETRLKQENIDFEELGL
jgi:hypothetical protein